MSDFGLPFGNYVLVRVDVVDAEAQEEDIGLQRTSEQVVR